MHDQIIKENQKKEEIFREEEAERKLADAFGLIYKADNMNRTFKNGDKLYVVNRRFTQNGAIVVLRTDAGLMIYRVYKCEDHYIFMDDTFKVVLREENPDIVGEVIGFERFIA